MTTHEREKSQIGNFFARIGRRVRSKSPVATLPPLPSKSPKKVTLVDPPTSKEDEESRRNTPKRVLTKHVRSPSTDGTAYFTPNGGAFSVENSPSVARPQRDSSLSRFGGFINRLSRRNKKVSLSASRDSSLEVVERMNEDYGSGYGAGGLKDRSAVSETDLRHVTLTRGSAMPQTPLAGCLQFRSEDQLATPVASTLQDRVPSYVRISCALNGYNTRSPNRFVDYRSQTERTPLGRTLVERRLQAFTEGSQSARCAVSSSSAIGTEFNTTSTPSKNSNGPEMGAALSHTPTPVKNLVAQFDRLQLCSPKRSDKENVHPHAIIVDPDAYACGVAEHEVHETTELPAQNTKEMGAVLAATQRTPREAAVSEPTPAPAKARSVAVTREAIVEQEERPSAQNRQSVGELDVGKSVKVETAHVVVSSPASSSSEEDLNHKLPLTNGVGAFEKSGQGYAKLLATRRTQLQSLMTAALKDLEEAESGRVPLPEPAMDALRLAAGKANLLLRKKLTKFEELVRKNLNPVNGDPQPATVDDLEGYWALVDMELEDIDACFDTVEKMRCNAWKEPAPDREKKALKSNGGVFAPKKPSLPAKTSAVATAKAAEEREKRRKAMAEAKERFRAQQNSVQPDGVMLL